MFMQTLPPVFYVPVQAAENAPQAVAVKPSSDAAASGSQGDAGHPDARGAHLVGNWAGEIARTDPEASRQRIEPLDTRVVGDGDNIDPDRPTVRGPEPAVQSLLPEDANRTSDGAIYPDRLRGAGPGTDTPKDGWDVAVGKRGEDGPEGPGYPAGTDTPRSVDIRR